MRGQVRHLLLLRHAKAVAAEPGMSDASDHTRALSVRGRSDAASLGQQLRARAMLPEIALVSTSRRTRETFDLLGFDPSSGIRLVASDGLYLASSVGLLDMLREQDAGSVLLIGHNPGLHDMALHLAAGTAVLAQGLSTCTLAAFEIEGAWPDLAPKGARLRCMLRP